MVVCCLFCLLFFVYSLVSVTVFGLLFFVFYVVCVLFDVVRVVFVCLCVLVLSTETSSEMFWKPPGTETKPSVSTEAR